nr:uncharacterized protein LOC127493670 [Oryctolagus cuniculus]
MLNFLTPFELPGARQLPSISRPWSLSCVQRAFPFRRSQRNNSFKVSRLLPTWPWSALPSRRRPARAPAEQPAARGGQGARTRGRLPSEGRAVTREQAWPEARPPATTRDHPPAICHAEAQLTQEASRGRRCVIRFSHLQDCELNKPLYFSDLSSVEYFIIVMKSQLTHIPRVRAEVGLTHSCLCALCAKAAFNRGRWSQARCPGSLSFPPTFVPGTSKGLGENGIQR